MARDLGYPALPPHWQIIRTHQGEFVLCPVCNKPCIQTSNDYLACEQMEHTGLVRHAGSVTESWSLLRLWELCERLPQAWFVARGEWALEGQSSDMIYRWVPGTLRCINGEWLPPNEYPLPPPGAILAVCKFRGQVGPRYFLLKGIRNVKVRKRASAAALRRHGRVAGAAANQTGGAAAAAAS